MLRAELLSLVDEDICLQIKPDNHRFIYLCDCGVASKLSIKSCHSIGAMFISHTHIDHFNNFSGIMRHQLAVGHKVVVCGPRGLARNVSCALNAYTWNLEFDEKAVWYEVREYVAPGEVVTYALRVPDWEPVEVSREEVDAIFSCDAFDVRCTILDHKTDSIAYLFEEPTRIKVGKDLPFKPGPWVRDLKEAFVAEQPDAMIDVHGEARRAGELFELVERQRGHTVGYIMDHLGSQENHDKIAALFADVDELYIECYYHDEDRALAIANHHSTAVLSGRAAHLARAKKAIPCHFSRRYNGRLDEIREDFERAWRGEE